MITTGSISSQPSTHQQRKRRRPRTKRDEIDVVINQTGDAEEEYPDGSQVHNECTMITQQAKQLQEIFDDYAHRSRLVTLEDFNYELVKHGYSALTRPAILELMRRNRRYVFNEYYEAGTPAWTASDGTDTVADGICPQCGGTTDELGCLDQSCGFVADAADDVHEYPYTHVDDGGFDDFTGGAPGDEFGGGGVPAFEETIAENDGVVMDGPEGKGVKNSGEMSEIDGVDNDDSDLSDIGALLGADLNNDDFDGGAPPSGQPAKPVDGFQTKSRQLLPGHLKNEQRIGGGVRTLYQNISTLAKSTKRQLAENSRRLLQTSNQRPQRLVAEMVLVAPGSIGRRSYRNLTEALVDAEELLQVFGSIRAGLVFSDGRQRLGSMPLTLPTIKQRLPLMVEQRCLFRYRPIAEAFAKNLVRAGVSCRVLNNSWGAAVSAKAPATTISEAFVSLRRS